MVPHKTDVDVGTTDVVHVLNVIGLQ